jgi:hypothetical protein
MIITYHEADDILLLQFNQQPIISEVLHGPQVTVGITTQGVGQITIRAAQATGLLPVYVTPKGFFKKDKPSHKKDKPVAEAMAFQENKTRRKKKCCESYKKGKRCKRCPNAPLSS